MKWSTSPLWACDPSLTCFIVFGSLLSGFYFPQVPSLLVTQGLVLGARNLCCYSDVWTKQDAVCQEAEEFVLDWLLDTDRMDWDQCLTLWVKEPFHSKGVRRTLNHIVARCEAHPQWDGFKHLWKSLFFHMEARICYFLKRAPMDKCLHTTLPSCLCSTYFSLLLLNSHVVTTTTTLTILLLWVLHIHWHRYTISSSLFCVPVLQHTRRLVVLLQHFSMFLEQSWCHFHGGGACICVQPYISIKNPVHQVTIFFPVQRGCEQ